MHHAHSETSEKPLVCGTKNILENEKPNGKGEGAWLAHIHQQTSTSRDVGISSERSMTD